MGGISEEKDSLNKIEIDIQNIKTQETVSRNRINKNCKTADDMAIQIIAEIEGSRYVDFSNKISVSSSSDSSMITGVIRNF